MSPPAVVWYVRQIGAPPGFWAAPWRPHGTRMPRRPLLSRPVRAGWTPFGSVGALRRDAGSHIFRRRGFKLDGPAQYGPQGECKTALTPATAPSPPDPCVHRLRLLVPSGRLWQSIFFGRFTFFDGFNGDIAPCSMGMQTLSLRGVVYLLPIVVFGGPPVAAAEKKWLRAHVCRVEFRCVREFLGVFLPSNNPSQGSSVCGWLFFCSPKITIPAPTTK